METEESRDSVTLPEIPSVKIRKALMDSAFPNGFVVATAYPEFKIEFLNETLVSMLGYESKAELLSALHTSAWAYVWEEDLPFVREKAAKRVRKGDPYEISYRAKKKDGSYIWVNQRSQHTRDEQGRELVFAYYTDITAQKQAQQVIATAIRGYDISIWEWNLVTNICTQTVHSRRCGDKGTCIYQNFPQCLFDEGHYHPDSVELARSVFDRVRSGEETVEAVLHTYDPQSGEYWWENVCYTVEFDIENHPIKAVAVGKDITQQKLLEQDMLLESRKYVTLVNSIPGGVGIYKMDEKFTPLYVNDRLCALCDMTKDEYFEAVRESSVAVFYPDDVVGMVQEIHAAWAEKRKVNYTCRMMQKGGGFRWTHISGEWLSEQDGWPVICAVFTDVHDQKTAEQALMESELRYEAAVKASGINIWEYQIDTDTITVYSNSSRIKKGCHVLENYIPSTLESGYLREDSVSQFLSMYEKIRRGEGEVTADLWYRTNNELGFWCERVTYTTIFDEFGKPVKSFGVGRDVTQEKNAEKQYQDELAYREAMQNAAVVSIHINLTKNKVLDGKSSFPDVTKKIEESTSAQAYIETICASLTNAQMRQQFQERFYRDALLRQFSADETSVSMDLSRIINGRRLWTSLTAHMMKQPENNDVVAFLYSRDITNEKVMHDVMGAIVATDYDFLVVVDAQRNSAIRYSQDVDQVGYASETSSFEEETHAYIRKFICPEDVERVLSEVTLENITRHLDENGTYSVFYALPSKKTGALLRKQLRFTYIHSEFRVFLMTRSDITAAFEEQEHRNSELAAALALAERASEAKTEFLSRMSHEIRTPMNAIMGMASIVSQHPDDSAFVLDCMEKSQHASHYLLSLINDILEMSRIESGKITLEHVPVDLREIISDIGTIITPQAELAGVHYRVEGLGSCHCAYVGDPVRIEQILVNLLSNAVKFTPRGGNVSLQVETPVPKSECTMLKFTVRDTGIGISPEFMPRLFEAFSQEHTGAASPYGGTGLGLAISRNLARLMGGDITVDSVLGSGTAFEARICLEQAQASALDQENNSTEPLIDLAQKRVLLVEDHPLNVLVATRILENWNMSVDTAFDGQQGLERFCQSALCYYDAILIDIRMPVMDGLQAAEAIRSLPRPDAATIPIIAMTANAFAADVQKSAQAGMNAHLAKPIEPDLLYRTLSSLLKKHT